MVGGGGLLNWCPSFCTESHSCSGCHSSYLHSECSTMTCDWPLQGHSESPCFLSCWMFFLTYVVFFVTAALWCWWQSPHSARKRRKNTEECSSFLFFFSERIILKVVFHLNGQLPTDGIEAIQKPQQAAGCVRAGFWTTNAIFIPGHRVPLYLPLKKGKVDILNVSAFIHAQVAVGSLKGWARLLS